MTTRQAFTEILPNLFLGSVKQCLELKQKFKNCVLIYSDSMTKPHFCQNFIQFELSDFPDEPIDKILKIFKEATEYIASKENEVTLVCCGLGASRSASVMIAYLMKYKNMS